jgi:hypothetical protein
MLMEQGNNQINAKNPTMPEHRGTEAKHGTSIKTS